MNGGAAVDISDPAFDPDSFDFVAYIARQRGVSRPSAAELIKQWLVTYVPSDETKRAAGPPAGSRERDGAV